MARPPSVQPTDGELEILNVLWDVGPAEFGTIRKVLGEKRPVVATTLATMLKLMREKGLVERADGPRGYLWSVKISRKDARAGLLGKLVDLAFGGSSQRLVAHMLEEKTLSAQDRAAIRRMLDDEGPREKAKKGDGTP